LPPPYTEKYPADADDTLHRATFLRVSLEEVKANFERYDLLDGQVRFLEGWFRDTLPRAPIERLAVMRLDGDMYESTMDALVALYPKLSADGYVIIDDYILEGCRHAVRDFRAARGITDEIKDIDGTGVYWRRTAGGG
jgi:O-methyltransferase